MTNDVGIALISLAGAIILAWIKQNNDVTRLKEQIRSIEKTEDKVQDMLMRLNESMQRLERALVKAGFIDVD
jgi:prefoldin subunit 5